MDATTYTLTEQQQFYCRSMGKLLRVIAISNSDEAANSYMARHDNAAVIACVGPFVLMANKWDRGERAVAQQRLESAEALLRELGEL